MKSRKSWVQLFSTLIITVMIISFIIPGCVQTKAPTSSTQPANSPTSKPPVEPIRIKVEFPNGAPALNQTAELTCTILTNKDPMKDMSIEIVLPEGLQLVSGQLSWTGELPLDTLIQAINANIKATRVGNWTAEIKGNITPIAPGGYGGKVSGNIYVAVSENSAKWSLTTPPWLGGGPAGTAPVTSKTPEAR